MNDLPGLTDRLRRRSRRAGLAVGLSMIATTALIVLAFAWIYAALEPMAVQFAGAAPAGQTAAAPTVPGPSATTEATRAAATPSPTPAPTQPPVVTPEPTATPSPTPDVFRATNYSNPDLRVNLRSQPGTDNEPVAVLEPSTPLQALDQQAVGSDGATWAKFRTEDGREGWLRSGTYVGA